MFAKDELPILGILRGIRNEHLETVYNICMSSGLKHIEITMNTAGAPLLIRNFAELAGKNMIIGAGTVLSVRDTEDALAAGARYIVSPTVADDVLSYCAKNNIPVFPGALTPTEVQKAWELGATMVKLFPASAFGPKYIKELKGPFDGIKIMAVGGVNDRNIGEYFHAGADAVAFGASIFNINWLEENKTDIIRERLDALIKNYLSVNH